MANPNKVKVSFFFRIKRLFFGIGKEFRRIQWIKGRTLTEHIIIVILMSAFLAGLFYAVYALIVRTGFVS